MIAELGNYALALSLAVSFFLAIFPLWGAEKGHPQLMSLARPMTYGLFFSLTIAFAALFYLFAVNDFSVQYVVGLIITLDLVINPLGRSGCLI